MRRPRRLGSVAVVSLALAGCSALIDVKDIYLVAEGSGTEAGADAPISPEGSTLDGGDSTVCVADTNKDTRNCGRCGHDCLGGGCQQGVCQAFQLTSIANAPLNYIVETGTTLFVGTDHQLASQAGGIWRVAKASGAAVEHYVTLTDAEQMVVLDDTLYFVVTEPASAQGGLYSCPVSGPSPCAPHLIASAELPSGIAIDRGSVFYTDSAPTKGVMRYTPPSAPTVFRADYAPLYLYVDDAVVFYTGLFGTRSQLLELPPDASFIVRSFYDSPTADLGRLLGSADAILFTAYDFEGPTTGGVVRRYPRKGTVQACDFGGSSNKRPYGIHADANRVYWTNQGDGKDRPWVNGSLASCSVTGPCCTTPDVLWSGDGQPSGLTGDASALYFVTYGSGMVWKVAKP